MKCGAEDAELEQAIDSDSSRLYIREQLFGTPQQAALPAHTNSAALDVSLPVGCVSCGNAQSATASSTNKLTWQNHYPAGYRYLVTMAKRPVFLFTGGMAGYHTSLTSLSSTTCREIVGATT